jgi:PAS domain-containing protein
MAADLDFAALFDVAPNAYMVVDGGLRYVAANAAYLEVTSSTREDLLGRHVFERFPNDPADPNNVPAQMLRKSLERVLATGTRDHLATIPYRVPQRLADGSFVDTDRYWSATHVPILDASGKVALILQHTVDVTELHEGRSPEGSDVRSAAGVLSRAKAVQQANTKLDAEREQLRVLFQQAPGFMAVLEGPEHVFRLANEAYRTLIGGRDVLGKPLREALPEIVDQGFFGILDGVRNTGEPFIGQGVSVFLERHAGSPPEERFVDFIYQPVRGAGGAVDGIFVQGHDVTGRVLAEREMAEARRAAEAFSAELTEQSAQVAAALAQAQLRIQDLEAKLAAR